MDQSPQDEEKKMLAEREASAALSSSSAPFPLSPTADAFTHAPARVRRGSSFILTRGGSNASMFPLVPAYEPPSLQALARPSDQLLRNKSSFASNATTLAGSDAEGSYAFMTGEKGEKGKMFSVGGLASAEGSTVADDRSSTAPVPGKLRKRPFTSHLYDRQAGNHKPWMNGRTEITRDKKSYWVTMIGILAGIGGAIYINWTAWDQLKSEKWCPLYEDNFEGPTLNDKFWKKEVRLGGGHSNDFTWFTDSDDNSFIKDGKLYLMPTLTNDTCAKSANCGLATTALVTNTSTAGFNGTLVNTTNYDYSGGLLNSTYVNLGAPCDSIHRSDCSIGDGLNTTLVLPPIRSAMISTRNKLSMRGGRVTVRAKMPRGDWLWPKFAMVPLKEVYGDYPASGMIDIFSSRGNQALKRSDQLNNQMICGLHWGPVNALSLDRFYLTQGLYKVYRDWFTDGYYTFGLDWTDNQVTMWVNTRVRKAFNLDFAKRTLWTLGQFPYSYGNGTLVNDPWAYSNHPFAAPFDQEFYLQISLAVGGTDGYWQDTLLDKPWRNSDERPTAMSRFWLWNQKWLPTWPSGDKIDGRALIVDKIQMWSAC